MHESEREIDGLQALLDRSYSGAGEHLLSVHSTDWRMSAREVCDLLQNVCVLDLATVSRTSRPFVAPVDGLFLHGKFWFGSSHASRRFGHIRQNPWVSAAHTRGEEFSVVVHGKAHEVDTSTGDHETLRGYCREVYGETFDSWGKWGTQPFAWIEADRMFAIRIQLGE